MALKKRQNLAYLAIKFLKFQVFTKSASVHTSKSYAIDLRQFFSSVSFGKNFFRIRLEPHPELTEEALREAESLAELCLWDEDQLYRWALDAQREWSELTPASRQRKVACLKSFYSWLLRENYIQEDVGGRLFSPKVPQKIPHFISVDEVMALIRCLQESKEKGAAESLALILLLYGGGLRVSEACEAQWKNLDFSKGTLRVLGKGGKERILALPDLCLMFLKSLPREHRYVFGDEPMNPRKAYELVRSWGARAGLVGQLHPHALRHSYATHLLNSGADIRVLQELLGHSSLNATQKYTHLGIDQLARTVESHHPLGEGARKTKAKKNENS